MFYDSVSLAAILFLATSCRTVSATDLHSNQSTSSECLLIQPLSYSAIVVDNNYSKEAVRAISEAVFRLNCADNNHISTEGLHVVNVNMKDELGACRFIHESAVVHLSKACLPKYASRLRTPVLTVPNQLCGGTGPLAHVSFIEGDDSELPVLLDVARIMNWTSAVYVGDTSKDTLLLKRLLRCSRTFDLTDVISVNKADSTSLYARMKTSKVNFVLVHCQSYRCYEIVKKLLYLRSQETGDDSLVPWLMTEALTQNVHGATISGQIAVPNSNTYGLQKTLPNSPLSDILLEDVSSLEKSHSRCFTLEHCSATLQQQLEVLAFYDSLTVLFNVTRNIRQHTFKRSSSLIRHINEANLIGVNGAIRFDHISSQRSYSTIYNVLDIRPFLVANIGVYDSSKAIWLQELRPLSGQHATRSDRHRRASRKCQPAVGTFRVTTMIEPPFIIYDPNITLQEAHNGPYAGFVVDMMEWLATELGFTYTMSEPPDLKSGAVKNATGTGMVGQLMNCEADLAAAAFAITVSRSEYIQFTKPYIEAGKTLLVYKGEAKSTGLWAFLNPFDVATRIVVVACVLVVSVVFALLGKLNAFSKELQPSDSRRRRNVEWPANSFWFVYTTFMQQGPDIIPSLAGKVLVAGWFFFCLVIVATYTANLAAFLTVKSFEDTIQSLDDLAKQTETIYGTVKDTSITDFFESSPLEIHQRMYWFMINTPDSLVETAEEAYNRVHYRTKGDYVFIWDEPILDYIASHEPCKSQVVGRAFVPQGYGFAMPKGMPYESNFTLGVLKLREMAMIENLRRKWLQSGPCSTTQTAKDVTDAEEVRISDMLGVFTILGSTVGASVVIALLELLWWKRKNQRTVAINRNQQVPSQTYLTTNTAVRDAESPSESD